ncbi:DUF6093 family protein [Streptomyces sp. NPDC059637]
MTTQADRFAGARAVAETRVLTDTVKIYVPGTFDPDTWETLPDVVLWEGPGAVHPDEPKSVFDRGPNDAWFLLGPRIGFG